MKDLTQQDKINIAIAVGQWKEGEDAKYWTRYSIFLTMNSGLLAASFIGNTSILNLNHNGQTIPLGGLVIGIFGIVLTYTWLKLLEVSKLYISRWISDLDTIMDSDESIKTYIKGYSDSSSRVQQQKPIKKATEYAKLMVISYLAIWGIVLLEGIWELLSYIIG